MPCSNGLAATSLRTLLAVSGADTSQPTAAVNDRARHDPGTVTALTPSDCAISILFMHHIIDRPTS